MISSGFVFLLAFAGISSKTSIRNEECLHPISWPDPTNCARYYVCVPLLMDCAPGTHYNPELQQCDSPYNANCQVSTTPSPSTITAPTEPPEPDTTTTPEPEPSSSPEPAPTTTPEPTESPQPEPTTTIISTSTDGRTPVEICQENSGAFFVVAYPGDCTKFIACNYGDAHVIDCPSNTPYFHPILLACNVDQSVCY